MGNILLKRVRTQKILKSKSIAKIIKDKQGKSHCSRCGAYISK